MIKVSPDTPKIIALEGMVERLEEALAAKTADFDRLCKDFDAHDAELKRIIAGLRAALARIGRGYNTRLQVRQIARDALATPSPVDRQDLPPSD